jgi:hypothetical protein
MPVRGVVSETGDLAIEWVYADNPTTLKEVHS